jgi:hypothetical protein
LEVVMKLQLSTRLLVLLIAVLSPSVVHAAEPGAVGVQEAVTEGGAPADPVTAQLQSEVLRYYRGIGAEPTEAQLKAGLDAAFDIVLADVSIEQISLAIEQAIKGHETGVEVPFAVAVPRFLRAVVEDEDEDDWGYEDEAPEAVRQPVVHAVADQRSLDEDAGRAGDKARRDRTVGTVLMVSAFVAQGFTLVTTLATAFAAPGINDNGPGIWIIQAGSIPFAPLGVTGFALRFGGSSAAERLHWTGIGLLEAAAYSGLVGGLSLASLFVPGIGEWGIMLVPGMFAHLGASIAFAISGGVCIGVASSLQGRQRLFESRRSPGSTAPRGSVMPTIAPRPDGLSLGLVGVF